MQAFTYAGIFWGAEDPTRKIPGRIEFDPVDGSYLTITGSLIAGDPFSEDYPRNFRVFGETVNGNVTLEDCQLASSRVGGKGLPHERYRVQQVIENCHLEGPLEFDGAEFTFDQLPNWINRRALSWRQDRNEETGEVNETSLVAANSDNETAEREEFTLTVGSGWASESAPGGGYTVREVSHFRLEYNERAPLKSVLRDVKLLQDLLTLAADAPAQPVTVNLHRSNFVDRDGNPARLPFTAPQIAEPLFAKNPKSPHEMLFLMDDMGGIQAVANWLLAGRERKVVLSSLFSIRYSKMFVENRLQNVAAAAESLHRIDFPNYVMPKGEYRAFRRELVAAVPQEHQDWLNLRLAYANEPRLRQRLVDLYELVGFSVLLEGLEAERWAKAFTDVRNALAHDDGNRPKASGEDMFYLAECGYLLVSLALLKTSGSSGLVIESIKTGYRSRTLLQPVINVVDRLAPRR